MNQRPRSSWRALRIAGSIWLAAGLGAIAATASASVTDAPHFKVLGLIVVWGGDSAGTPIAADFIMDTAPGSTDHDFIAGDVQAVVTGTMVPLGSPLSETQGAPVRIRRIAGGGRVDADSNGDSAMDASDSFAPFGIGNATDNRTRRMELNTSFYVASNRDFYIDAVAAPVGSTVLADLDRVRGTLEVTLSGNDGVAFGASARYPHTGGATGGRRMNSRALSTLSNGRTVFRGNQSTAAQRGSLADQSVRFDILYRYNFGVVDLSAGTLDIEAEVIYTLYMP